MTREQIKELKAMQKQLTVLVSKYEEATADIAPPIKNINGMPFANTNDVMSPVELKAIRLEDLYDQIKSKQYDIMFMLKSLETVNSADAKDFLTYRYLYCYSYDDIKKKKNLKKSADSIRKICDYHLNLL